MKKVNLNSLDYWRLKIVPKNQVINENKPITSVELTLGGETELAEYLMGPRYEDHQERALSSCTHSKDSNSEGHWKNDYGDTPSCSMGESEGEDKESEESEENDKFEDDRVQRLYRLMGGNKGGMQMEEEDDCDGEGFEEGEREFYMDQYRYVNEDIDDMELEDAKAYQVNSNKFKNSTDFEVWHHVHDDY